MEFERWYVVLLFVPFLLLARCRREAAPLPVASALLVTRARWWKTALHQLMVLAWFSGASALIIALASPQTRVMSEKIAASGRVFLICVDASTSMGGGVGRSTMEWIKRVIIDFVEHRPLGWDLIGVSAFAGTPPYGRAAILSYPTANFSRIKEGIKRIQPATFLGWHTATGDGLFVSLLGILEEDFERIEREKGIKVDRILLQNGVTEAGLSPYAEQITRLVKKAHNRRILLFSDGMYNVGMDPRGPLLWAKALGIGVIFVMCEPSADTGLTYEIGMQRMRVIRDGALSTPNGRFYYGVQRTEVEAFFAEIDRVERGEYVMRLEKTVATVAPFFLRLGLFLLLAAGVLRAVFFRQNA